VPAKAAAARPPAEPDAPSAAADPPAPPHYRRPDTETVRWAARRALARGGKAYPSQAALRRAVLPLLHQRDPLFSLGGRRMRALLVDVPGLALRVRYAERPTRRPLGRCPVCAGRLRPIRNRTLLGDAVTLGWRCPRCGYWTHLRRRVPVRYVFVPVGIDGTPAPPVERLRRRRSE
jgi:hypothetical protein